MRDQALTHHDILSRRGDRPFGGSQSWPGARWRPGTHPHGDGTAPAGHGSDRCGRSSWSHVPRKSPFSARHGRPASAANGVASQRTPSSATAHTSTQPEAEPNGLQPWSGRPTRRELAMPGSATSAALCRPPRRTGNRHLSTIRRIPSATCRPRSAIVASIP
jgi:hypothetical protein